MIFRGMSKELIAKNNRIINDILLNGKDFKVLAIRNKETKQINDYEFIEEQGPSYIDEDRLKISLFDLLVLFIYQNAPKKLPQYAIIINACRNILGLTQKELAKKLEVDYTLLQRWEAGTVFPSFPNIMKMCKLFDIKPEYFMK